MNDTTKSLLKERIEECLCKLETLQAGTKEYSAVTEDLNTLYKLKIEEDKNTMYDEHQYREDSVKSTQVDNEYEMQKVQVEEQRKDRKAKIIGIAVDSGVFLVCAAAGFLFECSGHTYSYGTFRNFFKFGSKKH